MSRRSISRLTVAFFAACSLLFTQLALANHACPRPSDVAAMASMVAKGEPCPSMDQAQATLCHQHCTGAAQSFEAIKLPTASAPAVIQVRELPLVPDADAAAAPSVATTPPARPPPDPLFLATLRLRV